MTVSAARKSGNRKVIGKNKKANRNAWFIFLLFGAILGLTAAFISGTSDVIIYAALVAVGAVIGFVIGRSLDRYANKKQL